MRKIKVGLIQQSNTADIRMNLMNLAKSIEACAAHGAQLIVLQELHNSLYFCQTENTNLFDLAEPIPGPSTGFYSELAAANRVVLVTSLFEKRAPGLYHNTAVVFDRDGSIAGKYRKMHIPDDPAYYEKFYFTPGDIGFEPIQTSLGKLGVLVCWDQWYPEAMRTEFCSTLFSNLFYQAKGDLSRLLPRSFYKIFVGSARTSPSETGMASSKANEYSIHAPMGICKLSSNIF